MTCIRFLLKPLVWASVLPWYKLRLGAETFVIDHVSLSQLRGDGVRGGQQDMQCLLPQTAEVAKIPPPLPPGLRGAFETSPSKTKTSSPICAKGPSPHILFNHLISITIINLSHQPLPQLHPHPQHHRQHQPASFCPANGPCPPRLQG